MSSISFDLCFLSVTSLTSGIYPSAGGELEARRRGMERKNK